MPKVNASEASSCVHQNALDDSVDMSLQDNPAAQKTMSGKGKKAIDLDLLQMVTANMKEQPLGSADFIREMRDNDRF